MIGKIVLNTKEIYHIVRRLSDEITWDYFHPDCMNETPKMKIESLTLLCVLKGSLIFTSDLMRRLSEQYWLDKPIVLDTIEVSSYKDTHSTNKIGLIKPPSTDLTGKDVLIVEDIIDTGLTINYIKNRIITNYRPHSLKICSLLYKKEKDRYNTKIDYLGAVVPDTFLVGYGLDFNGLYRNLPSIHEWID